MGEQYNTLRNNSSALYKTLPPSKTNPVLGEQSDTSNRVLKERRAVAGLEKTLNHAKEKS